MTRIGIKNIWLTGDLDREFQKKLAQNIVTGSKRNYNMSDTKLVHTFVYAGLYSINPNAANRFLSGNAGMGILNFGSNYAAHAFNAFQDSFGMICRKKMDDVELERGNIVITPRELHAFVYNYYQNHLYSTESLMRQVNDKILSNSKIIFNKNGLEIRDYMLFDAISVQVDSDKALDNLFKSVDMRRGTSNKITYSTESLIKSQQFVPTLIQVIKKTEEILTPLFGVSKSLYDKVVNKVSQTSSQAIEKKNIIATFRPIINVSEESDHYILSIIYNKSQSNGSTNIASNQLVANMALSMTPTGKITVTPRDYAIYGISFKTIPEIKQKKKLLLGQICSMTYDTNGYNYQLVNKMKEVINKLV